MAYDPYSNRSLHNVVEKVIGKTLKIEASQSAGIEMEVPWISPDAAESDLKLGIEVIAESFGNGIVFREDFLQVDADPLVEPNFHGVSNQIPIRRK